MSEITKNHVFKVIPESTNIIMTLVDSINTNETFQRHVNKLSDSNNQKDQKKALLINTTIHKIKVFNTKINPLFLAKDIGILMGISQINYLIRKFEPEERVMGYITKNNKTKKVIFLTKHGIYRCFFASRSPLARLFRKFICNLIDHMIENESEIMEKLSAKFQVENDELIKNGMADLHNKLTEIESKYIEEKKKTLLLEIQCEEEQKKRIETEGENTEISILNTYNMMHIEQLKKEKSECINQIKTIRDNVISDKSESIDLIEIKLLKEKFMKPMYIYILHPMYFKKMLKTKQKELLQTLNAPESFDADNDDDNNDGDTRIQHTLENINYLITDTTYETNFINIFAKNDIYIEPDEILYYHLYFGRNIAKMDKLILVNTLWVANRQHFVNILKAIKINCDTLELHTKLTVYKTSSEEINDISREEFITLDKIE